MKYSILPLILLISACGQAPKFSVDPALEPYVISFYSEASNKGKHIQHYSLVVTMDTKGDLQSKGYAGICHLKQGEHPWVEINQVYWNSADTQHRQQVVYHELGHCLLGRAHKSNRSIDGTIKSLMFPDTSLNTNMLIKYHEEYVNELFGLTPVIE